MEFLRQLFTPDTDPTYSISLLLDETHAEIIEDTWQELADKLDIEHPYKAPLPHITCIQASAMEQEKVVQTLKTFASKQTPFVVRTAGLGIFTGDRVAVYVSIVRDPLLSDFHESLVDALTGTLDNMSSHHLIQYWMPHISLVLPGTGELQLPRVIELLSKRDFHWEFEVEQLSVLNEANKDGEPDITVRLGESLTADEG
jgi:hypothetical protein